jgi:hypothetical protein
MNCLGGELVGEYTYLEASFALWKKAKDTKVTYMLDEEKKSVLAPCSLFQ